MVFVETGPLNIRRQLLDTTEAWRKASMAASCASSLRQTLLGVVCIEAGGPAQASGDATAYHGRDAEERVSTTANQPQWKYVTWSPEKGTCIPALEKEPLSEQNALEAVRMLKLMATKGGAATLPRLREDDGGGKQRNHCLPCPSIFRRDRHASRP